MRAHPLGAADDGGWEAGGGCSPPRAWRSTRGAARRVNALLSVPLTELYPQAEAAVGPTLWSHMRAPPLRWREPQRQPCLRAQQPVVQEMMRRMHALEDAARGASARARAREDAPAARPTALAFGALATRAAVPRSTRRPASADARVCLREVERGRVADELLREIDAERHRHAPPGGVLRNYPLLEPPAPRARPRVRTRASARGGSRGSAALAVGQQALDQAEFEHLRQMMADMRDAIAMNLAMPSPAVARRRPASASASASASPATSARAARPALAQPAAAAVSPFVARGRAAPARTSPGAAQRSHALRHAVADAAQTQTQPPAHALSRSLAAAMLATESGMAQMREVPAVRDEHIVTSTRRLFDGHR